jgi:hypothetical protein
MKNNNLDLWNRVEKTDPKHTKKAKIGGMKITAVAPQYQILNATREFGVYGVKWGFKSIELDYSLIDKFNLIVFKGTFFCPDGEFQIINSSKMFMDRNETMIDSDFAKKIETDALTKALSKMGFNADIFMGRYDDVKYVNELKEEFITKPSLSDDKLKGCEDWTDAQKQAVKSKYKLSKEQLNKLA